MSSLPELLDHLKLFEKNIFLVRKEFGLLFGPCTQEVSECFCRGG